MGQQQGTRFNTFINGRWNAARFHNDGIQLSSIPLTRTPLFIYFREQELEALLLHYIGNRWLRAYRNEVKDLYKKVNKHTQCLQTLVFDAIVNRVSLILAHFKSVSVADTCWCRDRKTRSKSNRISCTARAENKKEKTTTSAINFHFSFNF